MGPSGRVRSQFDASVWVKGEEMDGGDRTMWGDAACRPQRWFLSFDSACPAEVQGPGGASILSIVDMGLSFYLSSFYQSFFLLWQFIGFLFYFVFLLEHMILVLNLFPYVNLELRNGRCPEWVKSSLNLVLARLLRNEKQISQGLICAYSSNKICNMRVLSITVC